MPLSSSPVQSSSEEKIQNQEWTPPSSMESGLSPSKGFQSVDEIVQTQPIASKEAADDDQVEYPHGIHLVAVTIALILALLLAVMDMTILATAIPHITDEFHSLDDIGWYASVFFMTVASTQSTWGKAYKYFDLKTVFLIAIAIFELASVANNSKTLIVGRAITGCGAAGVIAGCYTIAAFSVPAEKRPLFTGAMAATYGIGSSIAPVLGGALADTVTWRWCFYINLPIGAVSAAVILLTFKTPAISRNEDDHNASWSEKLKQMDLIGTFTILAAVTCLLLTLLWGGVSKSWKSADVIGCFVGFGLITIVFVVIEYYQGERALLVPRIMKKRVVYTGCVVSFFLGGGEFTLIYYIPIYFQAILGVSAQDSGVRNLAFIIAATLFTVIAGAAITTTGYFTPFIVVGAALMTVASGLIYTFSLNSTAGAWIGYQVLAGIGLGLCFQPPIMAAQALADPADVSATTAIMLFFQTMGGAFMVSSAQAAFTNTLVRKLAIYAPGIDSNTVIAVGVTKIRQTFTDHALLLGVVNSYMDGLKVAFAIVVALTGCATVCSVAMPWISIKGKQITGPMLNH